MAGPAVGLRLGVGYRGPDFRRGYLGRGRTANAPSRHRDSSGMLMLGRGHWQERPGLVGRP